MRFLLFIFAALTGGCSSSTEKTKVDYSFEQLDFDFPLSAIPLKQQEGFSKQFEELWLKNVYVKEFNQSESEKVYLRMVFVSEGKINSTKHQAYCSQKGGASVFAESFHLPFVARLGEDASVGFYAPFNLNLENPEIDCSAVLDKKYQFTNDSFLYEKLHTDGKKYLGESGESGTGGKIEWASVAVKNGLEIFTKTVVDNLVKVTKALYSRDSSAGLGRDFSGSWINEKFEAASQDQEDSEDESENNDSDRDNGSVNISIPESWFE
jgi:hypothetical protein